MAASAISSEKKSDKDLLHFICAFTVTLFLFFIDEGDYNFKWMLSGGSWFVFSIYAVVLFLGQSVMRDLVLRKYNGAYKTVLSVSVGIILGLSLLFSFFYMVLH